MSSTLPTCCGVLYSYVDEGDADFFLVGYSDYQVYLMLSCAPIQGHVGGLVDIPNACMTLGLPMDIFDFDISPTGPAKKIEMGACAVASK